MTPESKHIVVQFGFRLALFIAWFALVTFLTTISCIALAHWLLQLDQVRASVQHRGFLRVVVSFGLGIIWIALQIFLGVLLPRMVLNKKVKHDADAD